MLVNDDNMKSLSANENDNSDDGEEKYRHQNIKDEKPSEQRKLHVPDANLNTDNDDMFKLFVDAARSWVRTPHIAA
ncbi:hypothetical protein EVAR_72708_1 [Eumeta japonica]|uniref:Uncharacterized protein n=1 Tax=Eumeta variegata TaxID=151549 RepID=A0A4C1SLT3_EUMVA|nr:hypothetical protein EVAR_72708_1 [Eumeta japonica]